MLERLQCKIDKSLQEVFTNFQFPQYIETSFLQPNEDVELKQYTVLILNCDLFPLNSDNRFRCEEKFDVIAYYDKRKNNPNDLVSACSVLLEIYNKPGVLSGEQIKSLMKLGILIYNGNETNIQVASYDLTLHGEFLRSGVRIEEQDIISIEPFAYVIVGAKELANLPTNICANYDLKVSMFCRGIILSNGPQVDPGYRGILLALLFNTSSKQFIMNQYLGYDFATMQFLSLSSPASSGYSGKNLFKKSIGEYIRQYADDEMSKKVGTIPKLKESMVELNDNLNNVNRQINDHNERIQKLSTDIDHLKGRNIKWTVLVTCIIGLIAALYSAVATFSGNNKVYDLGLYVGKVQEKVFSTDKQLADIEEKVRKNRKISLDQIESLKSKIESLENQFRYKQSNAKTDAKTDGN